jgi:hypothetical protein
MMYSIPLRIEMKISHLVLGVLLLALMSSQAMAISKSDLITYYRTNPEPFFNTTPEKSIPTTIPTVTPTPDQTLALPSWPYADFLKPFEKLGIASSLIDIPDWPSRRPITTYSYPYSYTDEYA